MYIYIRILMNTINNKAYDGLLQYYTVIQLSWKFGVVINNFYHPLK